MKKTLVLGASLNVNRYSNMAIRSLVQSGHEVVAVGLRKGVVDGVQIDVGMPEYKEIHTVTLYLNATRQDMYYDYILELQPERVIFNPGAENFEFAEMLKDKSIMAENSCTLVLLSTGQF